MSDEDAKRVRKEALAKIKKMSNAELLNAGLVLNIIDNLDAWEVPLTRDRPIKFISDM